MYVVFFIMLIILVIGMENGFYEMVRFVFFWDLFIVDNKVYIIICILIYVYFILKYV